MWPELEFPLQFSNHMAAPLLFSMQTIIELLKSVKSVPNYMACFSTRNARSLHTEPYLQRCLGSRKIWAMNAVYNKEFRKGLKKSYAGTEYQLTILDKYWLRYLKFCCIASEQAGNHFSNLQRLDTKKGRLTSSSNYVDCAVFPSFSTRWKSSLVLNILFSRTLGSVCPMYFSNRLNFRE